MRLDFLIFGLGAPAAAKSAPARRSDPERAATVSVPRETATYSDEEDSSAPEKPKREVAAASACIPLNYVPDPRQRIEMYRKLAEITDVDGIERLQTELRDRFGPLPAPVELMLMVAELKVLAAARDISVIETREDKLMLTRHGDFLMVGGKFPRLTRTTARSRLQEIKRLLRAIR